MPSPADFASILGARQRDEIFAVVLAVLARRFRRSALLAVRPDGVVGWAGQGERVRAEALRALDIPWSEPSLFLNVRMSRSFYLGPLPPLPRHKELAEALGGWPVECLVQPVLMREKTVAFLYVECASAQGATPADLTFVRELAGATAAALAAAIRLKKQRVI
jgi:GAF domain-containing protein